MTTHSSSSLSMALVLLAVFATANAGTPPAAVDARSTERTLEASTAGITLPASESGTLVVQGCSACVRNELRVTPRTRYLVGGESVTLAELSAFLRRSGPHFAIVHYGLDKPEVSRLQVSARLSAGPSR